MYPDPSKQHVMLKETGFGIGKRIAGARETAKNYLSLS